MQENQYGLGRDLGKQELFDEGCAELHGLSEFCEVSLDFFVHIFPKRYVSGLEIDCEQSEMLLINEVPQNTAKVGVIIGFLRVLGSLSFVYRQRLKYQLCGIDGGLQSLTKDLRRWWLEEINR